MWLVQGTSTCTQCWSSSRPRLLRATSWVVTTPTSSLKQLLLALWKDDHRVVQPRGKCPSCNCLAPPVCRFLFLSFYFLLMLWPAYHCSFMACCMSAHCLWLLDHVQAGHAAATHLCWCQMENNFPVFVPCSLSEELACRDHPRCDNSNSSSSHDNYDTNNDCIFKITSSWMYNLRFFMFYAGADLAHFKSAPA